MRLLRPFLHTHTIAAHTFKQKSADLCLLIHILMGLEYVAFRAFRGRDSFLGARNLQISQINYTDKHTP